MLEMARKPGRDWRADPPTTDGEKLRMQRESQRRRTGVVVTQRDAARLLGIDEDLYRAIEYDRRRLRLDEAKRLARAWLCRPEDLFLLEAHVAEPGRPAEATRPKPAEPVRMREIPIIGPVHAGDWTSPLDSEDFEPIPAEMWAPDTFCSYVVGDSMRGFLLPNDLAVFKSTLLEGRRTRPQIGDVVMARNHDNELTIKMLGFEDGRYTLDPINPEYERVSAEQWSCIGILVGYLREEDGDMVRRFNPRRLRPR